MCKYFHLQAAYGGSFNMYATETIFCFKFELGAAMLVCSLPMNSRKKKKKQLVTQFTPLPHMPDAFMMPHLVKMADLVAMFSRLPNTDFSKQSGP